MPVDSQGNITHVSKDAPPYSMGRAEYRKWLRRKRIDDKKAGIA